MATTTETDTFKAIATYSGATQYYKYDVVLHTTTGEKWWCKKATVGLAPTEGTFWTQKWFFVPTHSQQVQREPIKSVVRLGDGYTSVIALGVDFDQNVQFNFNWEGIHDRETKGLIEFCRDQNAFENTTTIVTDESDLGFWYQPPFPYEDYAGNYVISNLNHSHVSYNKNNVGLSLMLKNLQASP